MGRSSGTRLACGSTWSSTSLVFTARCTARSRSSVTACNGAHSFMWRIALGPLYSLPRNAIQRILATTSRTKTCASQTCRGYFKNSGRPSHKTRSAIESCPPHEECHHPLRISGENYPDGTVQRDTHALRFTNADSILPWPLRTRTVSVGDSVRHRRTERGGHRCSAGRVHTLRAIEDECRTCDSIRAKSASGGTPTTQP